MNFKPFAPRHFLPAEVNLTDLAALDTLFTQLHEQLERAQYPGELEDWLKAYGELMVALEELRSLRQIAMTCQTDDPEREKAVLEFVEVIDPWLKPRQFALAKQLTAHPAFGTLPDYYQIYARSVGNQVTLFREENIAREVAEEKLCQAYQKICGAMTVEFEGKEQTLTQVSKVLEETDRTRRQLAWETMAKRRLLDKEALETIFDQMLTLRGEIAQAAEHPNYRSYKFVQNERFDYSPENCLEFHQSIEELIVPLARALQEERRQKLGLERLRPWDMGVDPDQRPPLRPFNGGQELQDKVGQIFHKLDPRLSAFYQVMVDGQLMDLDNRKGKAPGGYQATLSEARVPFIFMNSVGQQRDVETLLHEAGHAFHTVAARTQELWAYRGSPIEFCEVASMSMELLAAPYLSEFYPPAELARARRDHLEGIIKFFPWMATIDAFQHWLYTHPGHSGSERSAFWLSLMDRFGGTEDWSDYEETRKYLWHRQLHLFQCPFYYVEYGIAQLGALQLWVASLRNPAGALDGYLKGLSLGGSKSLPELFRSAGIRFDFGAETIRPLVEAIQKELALLAQTEHGQ